MVEFDPADGSNDIIQKLMRVPGLKSFKEKEIQDLLRMSTIKTFKAGEQIFKEGSFENLTYYLISGKIKIIKKDKELLMLQRTGDVFGEMGPITGDARSASVYATDDSMCIEINISNIDKMPEDNIHTFRYIIFRGFAEVLASRLKKTTEDLIQARDEIERLQYR
ncbi:MAG: Crp/Fnr family transcriptional regulator [Desulfobacterales bacterium]|nr:MAG: Crp/Fnr family transcriptional regulator [Desulfobacterales bacterium]